VNSILDQHGRPLGALALYSLVSAGIGLFVTLVTGLGAPEAYSISSYALGALVGVSINVGALSAEYLVARLNLRGWWRRCARLASFFVGGGTGYTVLSVTVSLFRGGAESGAVRVDLESWAVYGLFAVLVGSVIDTIQTLRDQLRRSVEQLKDREFAERELETARTLQRRLLPPEELEGEGFRFFARNIAAHVVAGDFYDLFRLPDGSLGIVVADVVGKGMAAALRMASVKAMVPLVAADRAVEATLGELNRRLAEELGPREFVALSFARFDPRTHKLQLANGGLPDPYLLRIDGRLTEVVTLEVGGTRLPLGLRPGSTYEAIEVQLHAGDRVLWLTDGIPEATMPGSDECLGYERLRGLIEEELSRAEGLSLESLLLRLGAELGERGHRDDDWTVLMLEAVAVEPVAHNVPNEEVAC
jgi:serine phosphatase RsbU (regulator of sigma subunit)